MASSIASLVPEPMAKCAVWICVAHQHDMALAVEERPLLALDALEVQPGRTAQVARVGHQLGALQVLCEQVLAEGDGFGGVGQVQAVRLPDMFRALDDEGRGVLVEFVDVGLEPAVLGFFEEEGEGVVQLVRAQPDVAVGTHHDVGFEDDQIWYLSRIRELMPSLAMMRSASGKSS